MWFCSISGQAEHQRQKPVHLTLQHDQPWACCIRAAGISDEEMKAVLNIDEDDVAWHGTKGLLTQELHQPERCDFNCRLPIGFSFKMATSSKPNSWRKLTASTKPVQTVDFQFDPEATAVEANVAFDQTKGHILNSLRLAPSTA